MKSRIDFAHAQEILAAATPSRDFGQLLLMARHRIASPDKVESAPPSSPDPKKRELTPVERELSSLKWYARQPQELPKIPPKFQKLIDYYVIARTNANEPSVSQMVQQTVIDFLGIQPTDLLTVGTCFGRYLRPMIAFALEKLIHESGKYKKVDYLKDHPNGKAVSGVLQTVINPVEIGYRHTVNLPTAGTYYLVWGDQKLVVSFDFNGQCCSISSTVSTRNRGLGEAFLRDFNQSCAENNIYKNRTLTMSEGNLIFLKAESIRLKDVYLPGRIKNEVVENTIGVLENREELLKTSFGINRSILLSGEPGTGKTKLFKAIASTVPQCTVIWVSSKAFEYTSDVSLLYDAARDLGPTILVIEDMDLIGAERDSSRDNRLLGEFLTQMSGASANKTTITLASTNSLDKIDRALSNRPGRFDRVLEVAPPSAKFRKKMLVAFLTEFGVKVDVSDQTWGEVVDYTDGMTGAHLQEIAKTSLVKLVVAKKEKTLHDEDLLNATMLVVSNFKHSQRPLKTGNNQNG